MKVWIVTSGRYDDFQIECVVSRERDAILKSLALPDGGFEEHDVDTEEIPARSIPLFIVSSEGVKRSITTKVDLVETFGFLSARLGYGSTDRFGWSTNSEEGAQDMFAFLQKRIERAGKDEYAFKKQYVMSGLEHLIHETDNSQPKASKENPQMND